MDDKAAQEERSKKYGIAPKEGGHLTIPSDHQGRWPGISDDDYLDPVNYRYPCPDAEQTAVAARYWARDTSRGQYTADEQDVIGRRLDAKKREFKIGEYAVVANREDVESLALSTDVAGVPEEIQLLPPGWITTARGRFLADAQSRRETLGELMARKNDLVIDYEHQTLTGQVAPAAGWVTEVTDKGDGPEGGLWGRVEWTPRAKDHLANREYRYLSPVVLVRKTDQRAFRLHSAGLTNVPAIDGMVPVVNKGGIGYMEWLATLASILSLPATATWEDVQSTIQTLRQREESAVQANKEVLAALDLGPEATVEQARGAILALKNPSGHVSIEEFNALKETIAKREAGDLVAEALKAGKITPAQNDWATVQALKDPEGFRAFLKTAPQVVPLGQLPVTGGGAPAGDGLDEAQVLVNKQLGVDAESFKKFAQ